MDILIPGCKNHAMNEVGGGRVRIGGDAWVDVVNKWFNGGASEEEIFRYLDVTIRRKISARPKVKLKVHKPEHILIPIVCKAHVLSKVEDLVWWKSLE